MYALHTIDGRKLVDYFFSYHVVGYEKLCLACEDAVFGVDAKRLDVYVECVVDNRSHVFCHALSVNATHLYGCHECGMTSDVPLGSHDVGAERRLKALSLAA